MHFSFEKKIVYTVVAATYVAIVVFSAKLS